MLGEIIGAAASLIGGSKDRKAQEKANEQNAALQREFAQNQLQWKAADAEKAGISKLFAVGAPVSPATASFMPVQSGDSWREAGAGLARAAASGQTSMQRLQERLLESQIEGQEIDNAEKRSNLAVQRGQVAPPFPDGAYDGAVTPMYSTVRTPYGDRTMVSPAYGQVLENDITEFLRYVPRDFAARGSRLWNSIKGLGSAIKSRSNYLASQRG